MGRLLVPRLRHGLNDGARFTGFHIALRAEVSAYGPLDWVWIGRPLWAEGPAVSSRKRGGHAQPDSGGADAGAAELVVDHHHPALACCPSRSKAVTLRWERLSVNASTIAPRAGAPRDFCTGTTGRARGHGLSSSSYMQIGRSGDRKSWGASARIGKSRHPLRTISRPGKRRPSRLPDPAPQKRFARRDL